jgi:N-acetylglutamate synthase-like GNAT family acetyltransferase
LIPIERLPSEDFDSLKNIEEGYIPSKDSIVIVGKYESEIIARMFLIGMAHIEGTWIKPEFRSGALLRKLMSKMETEAKSTGLTKLFAYSDNDMVDSYLDRLKFSRSPLRIWTKDV